MEKKPSANKLLISAGILTLTLVAFFVGGVVLSSAHAASMGKPDQKGPPGPANGTKGIVRVTSVAGNTIQATVLGLGLPTFPKNSAVTTTTTASTIYNPDKSVVAPGKTIFVAGTVSQDGSITASTIGFYDPTIGELSGTITKIDGSTISVQANDTTSTILVTDSTTFSKGLFDPQTKTKSSQPASFSDLAVGETIEAQGKLNSDGSLTASTVVILPSNVPSDGGTK
jgi:hypothetical protein